MEGKQSGGGLIGCGCCYLGDELLGNKGLWICARQQYEFVEEGLSQDKASFFRHPFFYGMMPTMLL